MKGPLGIVAMLAVSLSSLAAAQVSGPPSPPQIYKPGSGISYPVLVREVKPVYSRDAMRAKIQGAVTTEVVVLADGTVGDVRVTRSLDQTFGLDQAAIDAAKQWRFTPAKKDGVPVPVFVTIVIEFRLRDGAPEAQTSVQTPASPRPLAVDDEFTQGTVAVGTPGLVMPKVMRVVHPKYTSDTMRAKIQGTVELEVVVMPDGTVGRVRVTRSLDPTLDEQAIAAARAWLFMPGILNGEPVAVAVPLTLEFKLH